MMFFDGAKLCSIYNLCISGDEYKKHSWTMRRLSKNCTLMFYPYQTADDIQWSGSYWKLLNRRLQLFKKGQETIMRKKEFEILQNIENRKNSPMGQTQIGVMYAQQIKNEMPYPQVFLANT